VFGVVFVVVVVGGRGLGARLLGGRLLTRTRLARLARLGGLLGRRLACTRIRTRRFGGRFALGRLGGDGLLARRTGLRLAVAQLNQFGGRLGFGRLGLGRLGGRRLLRTRLLRDRRPATVITP